VGNLQNFVKTQTICMGIIILIYKFIPHFFKLLDIYIKNLKKGQMLSEKAE